MLRIDGVWKKYGKKFVLQDINLHLKKGERLAVIGPVGAGKTTLLRLINLLEPPSSGRICFDGVLLVGKERLKVRRKMSMVFQRPILFSGTVFDNVAYGLRVRGEKDIDEKVKKALEIVGLLGFEGKSASSLSGGQIQQVAIARAIVTEPELLLLDEPTTYLDPICKEKIERMLLNIMEQMQMTVIVATHDFGQAAKFAEKCIVLLEGRIMQMGDAAEVFHAPVNEKVADLWR